MPRVMKYYSVIKLITLQKDGRTVESSVEHLVQNLPRISTIGSVARKMKNDARAHYAEVTVYSDARLTDASIVKTFVV